MNVNVFGKVDSPCVCNWSLKKTAKMLFYLTKKLQKM